MRATLYAIFLLSTLWLTPSSQMSSTQSSGQDEGQREAASFWNQYVASCGGSRYVRKAPSIFVELRGFRIITKYDPITEADRLNGVQAKGSSQFTASAHRVYFNSAWHAWANGIPDDMTLINSVRFQKARGRWTFQGVGYFKDYAHPVTCSDVPGFRSTAKNEVPSNSVQIDDTHVFPIESLTIWESSSGKVANRFGPSATFIGWKIIYTETAFNYKPPPVEGYWYKDGAQWAYDGSAQFSNVGKGQLWASRGWQEPGHWEVGSYAVKIYIRKQLVAVGKFEIVADDQLPSQAVSRQDNVGWRVVLRKGGGWLNTQIQITGNQQLHIAPDNDRDQREKQSFVLQLPSLDRTFQADEWNGILGIHTFFIGREDSDRYSNCLRQFGQDRPQVVVSSNWRDTLMLRMDERNPLNSITLFVSLSSFETMFPSRRPCMNGK